ncbi:MAG: AAA family ATPase [Bryobacter sp.]|jgi:SpoVK/Ycf46/Vps4 family AAA+-type ATPase|nr:AAA family ATPase [Bryobacter sp.]
MNIARDLEHLIRARYPILYIVSNEEARVDELLLEVSRRRQKKLFHWTCTTGLLPAGTSIQSQRHRAAATKEPLAALDQVIDEIEPALFVFKDLHPFLGKGNHAVVRRLREIALHLKNSLKTIVIVSGSMEIPPELDKEITVLNLPLPGEAEITALLDRIAGEVRNLPNVTLDRGAETTDRLVQAARGLTLTEAENVFARILVKHERLGPDLVGEILAEKKQLIRKSGLLEYYSTGETFEGVGGLEVLKDWLRKRGSALTPAARAFGLPPPRGILLLGVQGCGKSLSAKAVSNLWQVPLLRFDMGRMFGSFVGTSEDNVRRAIAVAESVAPAVLWVDEIDKSFAGSQGSAASDGGTTARVFGTFLTWLSEKAAPVFVVATANDISQLPPELLRKGRFDEIFFVDLPGEEERRAIFSIHLARRGRAPEQFDLAPLVAASDEFSGAEIEEAVISAMFEAFAVGEELSTRHLKYCLEQTVPLARTMEEHIRRLREWAAGRARFASGRREPAG